MMGDRQVDRGALFYKFSIDRHVPAEHMVRALDRFVDLADIRAHLTPTAPQGRPSVDPELLIRMLLVGYCFGIRSARTRGALRARGQRAAGGEPRPHHRPAHRNASTGGGHIWADRFDRDLIDLLELQDEITAEVVRAIGPAMLHNENFKIAREALKTYPALDYFQRGM
jgi:hypothetical protein